MYVLNIQNDRVVINIANDHRNIDTVEEFERFMQAEATRLGVEVNDLAVYASSSLDFPEEFTSNPLAIALARALR